eukprot:COSAG02_NODE_3091_length_7386_cov_7.913682_5_plen_121_part_00
MYVHHAMYMYIGLTGLKRRAEGMPERRDPQVCPVSSAGTHRYARSQAPGPTGMPGRRSVTPGIRPYTRCHKPPGARTIGGAYAPSTDPPAPSAPPPSPPRCPPGSRSAIASSFGVKKYRG